MKNIITFAEESGQYNFRELPFCVVDSLILSRLSYFNFSIEVVGAESIMFFKLNMDSIRENVLVGVQDTDENKRFLRAVCRSRRYRNVEISDFVDEYDISSEKQFSAVTFTFFADKTIKYVAYRGTDNTFVGWKEDFNMALGGVVPSQTSSMIYLTKIASKSSCDIIVGGHSKGGNLAVYASMMSDDNVKNRIITIYNHDGPGFRQDVINKTEFEKIKPKINKTVPQSSIVGMLMEEFQDYKVIKSNALGIMQHEPFNWEVDGTDFVYMGKLTKPSENLDRSMKQWLEETDDETRKIFIETAYDILTSTQDQSFSEIKNDFPKKLAIIYQMTKGIDEDTRNIIKSSILSLLKIMVKVFFEK